jgi:hypothetical protein
MHNGWDGRVGSLEQQTGTFVWMIQVVTKDNVTLTRRGTVTLIR